MRSEEQIRHIVRRLTKPFKQQIDDALVAWAIASDEAIAAEEQVSAVVAAGNRRDETESAVRTLRQHAAGLSVAARDVRIDTDLLVSIREALDQLPEPTEADSRGKHQTGLRARRRNRKDAA